MVSYFGSDVVFRLWGEVGFLRAIYCSMPSSFKRHWYMQELNCPKFFHDIGHPFHSWWASDGGEKARKLNMTSRRKQLFSDWLPKQTLWPLNVRLCTFINYISVCLGQEIGQNAMNVVGCRSLTMKLKGIVLFVRFSENGMKYCIK